MMIRRFLAFAAAAAMTMAMVSCGKESDSNIIGTSGSAFDENSNTPGYMVEILGVNANCPIPDTTMLSTGRQDPYTYICEHGGSAQSIVADGSPRNAISLEYTITPLNEDDYTAANYAKLINSASAALKKKLHQDLTPKAEDSSPIDAIIAASELLHPKAGQKYIAVMHSGIISSGYGSMTNLDFDVDTALEYLEKNQAIPDLTGVKVEWFGMNNVAGAQEVPTEVNKNTLRKFWTAYFDKANANFTIMSEIYSKTVQPDSSFPSVRPVPVGEILVPDKDTEITADIVESNLPVFPDDGNFSFKPNTAEFLNPEAARENIKPFTDYLKQPNAMQRVTLIGTCASVGDAAGAIELSKKRADAIKALIVNDGIDESRILTFGGGYTDPDFHWADLDENNNLIENVAQKNRAVFAIPSDDARAQKYLN